MATEDRSGVTTIYRPGADVDESGLCYPGFGPGRIVIEAGSVVEEDTALIERDLISNRDVEVELRGGTKIYTDVYRQADAAGSLHAIIAWSPYGKREGFIIFDGFPTAPTAGSVFGMFRRAGPARIWSNGSPGTSRRLLARYISARASSVSSALRRSPLLLGPSSRMQASPVAGRSRQPLGGLRKTEPPALPWS